MKNLQSGATVLRNPVAALAFVVVSLQANAATYEWTFDGGNLATALGNGTMSYADSESQNLTSFGTTGGGVPNIGGNPAKFIHVPAFANLGNGYSLTFNSTGPNGGGAYVNNYTLVMDLLTPNPPAGDWTALFNTDPANSSGNDADFYLAYDYSVGIGDVYSAANALPANTWHRLAFVDNGTSLAYYVDGALVGSKSTGVSIDGRWSLYSNLDSGSDLLLFNEGDTSGQYTHELYVNSIAFVDQALTGGELSALGGPNAQGIFAVPEPSVMALGALSGLVSCIAWSRRHNKMA